MGEKTLIDGPENLARMIVNGWLVDARGGGLVVGRLHSDGHILMVIPGHELGEYDFAGYMEGGEFIMCREATINHRERLEEINADNAPCTNIPQLSVNSRIIHTRAEPHDKIMLIYEQFIININSTNRHFAELEALNNKYLHYRGRVFTDEELGYITSLP